MIFYFIYLHKIIYIPCHPNLAIYSTNKFSFSSFTHRHCLSVRNHDQYQYTHHTPRTLVGKSRLKSNLRCAGNTKDLYIWFRSSNTRTQTHTRRRYLVSWCDGILHVIPCLSISRSGKSIFLRLNFWLSSLQSVSSVYTRASEILEASLSCESDSTVVR